MNAEEIMEELVGRSVDEGLSVTEWKEFLQDLKDEVRIRLSMAEDEENN